MKLRAYIVALHAALFSILLAVSPAGLISKGELVASAEAGSMMLLGAGKAGAAAAPAKAYIGSFSNAVGLPAGTSIDMTVTMTGSAGLVAAFFGVGGTQTITSVVYDPAGANVTLTQDAFDNPGYTIGVWSGSVPAASGTKIIRLTASASLQFQNAAGQAFLLTNLISPTKQAQVAITSATATLGTPGAISGYFLVGGAFSPGANTGVTFTASTETPVVHADADNLSFGAEWTIAATAGTFNVVPKSPTSFGQAYAMYH